MGFVAMMLTAVVVVHLYLWRRLVRASTIRGSRPRRVLTWVLLAPAVVMVVAFLGGRLGIGMDVERVVAWPGYLWLAVMFYLFVFGLVMEVPRAVATFVVSRRRRTAEPAAAAEPVDGESAPVDEVVLAGAAAGGGATAHGTATTGRPVAEGVAAAVPAIDRRLFISRTASAVVAAGALATVGYGVSRALGDPVIERVPVRLPRLDPRMSGLRIAVVSDIHLGPLTGRGHTERIVRMINGLEADAVTIVGDLVDGTVAELGRLAAPLRSLESRYGAYFVTGNHEYYTAAGPQEWIEELRSLGVRPLRNERVEIRHAGAVLDLAGVNDLNGVPSGDGPDFDKALGGRDANRPVVLMAHQPVQVTQAAAHGVDLQLSGHTHGGQMAPINLFVPLQQPVVAGLASVPRTGGGDTQVYVTRGAGFWGPPVRVGAPPEITLIELRT
ncbi:metallophosphoesterase [Microbispora sp. NPDC046933]|uniref:metallophosphoesterase n=1 Tax=Microbispora sp. NPDC046933 TaxID=3155618 RepID=UPI0033FED258